MIEHVRNVRYKYYDKLIKGMNFANLVVHAPAKSTEKILKYLTEAENVPYQNHSKNYYA